MTAKRRSKGKTRRPPQARTAAASARATVGGESEAPSRPGLFGGVFGRRPTGPSPLGRLTTALGRGFLVVGGSWPILLVSFVALFGEWAVLIALGTRTTPRFLVTSMALPPIGSAIDYQSAQALGGTAGIVVGFALLVSRAFVVAVLTGLIIGVLEGRRASLRDARRGLRAVPFVVAINVVGLSALLVGGSLLQVLGFGLQFLGNVMLITALLHFLGFVPAIAIRERLGLMDTLRRSRAAVSLAGGQQFTFCLLYVVALLFVLPLVGTLNESGGLITANPSVSAWLYGMVATYVNVSFLAALSYRWMAAEPHLATEPVRRRAR
jgi:hypothetical protein